MDLQDMSLEIRDLLEKKRNEIDLTFIEESHMYYMRDLDGIIKNTFPSVSKVYGKFYEHFDADTKAFQMARGDEYEQQLLLEKWKNAADYSTNMGSRVHYELEKYLIQKNGSYKEVRQPIYEIDDGQRNKSDNMIVAGKNFINLMEARGAVLLDTETVLGDPELGYVGQPDKNWLMLNKNKDGFGIVTTDWKGLPLDTPILTNNGWKTMGTLTYNDKVFDNDGNMVKIKHISKIKNIKCLSMKFDNGEEIVSDFEHRWLVFTKHNNKIKEMVLTTQEIKNYCKITKRISHKILKIENPKPLKIEKRDLPIDPYLFGVWLGDGHSRCGMITQQNELVWDEIKKRGYVVGNDVSKGGSGLATSRTIIGLRTELRKLNLLKNKHLPEIFLLSSYEQRLDILRGLMDTDGCYHKKRNRYTINTTKQTQVNYSVELFSSMGLKPTVIKYFTKINNKIIQCYSIEFTNSPFNPFLCKNQNINFKQQKNKSSFRNIKSVTEVDSVPTICIEVDSPKHTFLIGKSLIVTHNTNQPKNFEIQPWTNKMYEPFTTYDNTALGHYYLQLPLYGRLLLKMLKGTKYENIKLLGCVVVLLRDDSTYTEYRVPQPIINTILSMDIKKYLN